MVNIEEDLRQALSKVCNHTFDKELSDDDDNLLCLLEQTMGGSMLDQFVDDPANMEYHLQELLSSDEDDWLDKDSQIQEIIKSINDWINH